MSIQVPISRILNFIMSQANSSEGWAAPSLSKKCQLLMFHQKYGLYIYIEGMSACHIETIID